jgi:alpha-glucosidase
MLDVLRFWLDRGVDGFRVDVIWHLIKDESFSTIRRIRSGMKV